MSLESCTSDHAQVFTSCSKLIVVLSCSILYYWLLIVIWMFLESLICFLNNIYIDKIRLLETLPHTDYLHMQKLSNFVEFWICGYVYDNQQKFCLTWKEISISINILGTSECKYSSEKHWKHTTYYSYFLIIYIAYNIQQYCFCKCCIIMIMIHSDRCDLLNESYDYIYAGKNINNQHIRQWVIQF